jgi:hypothetical protein
MEAFHPTPNDVRLHFLLSSPDRRTSHSPNYGVGQNFQTRPGLIAIDIPERLDRCRAEADGGFAEGVASGTAGGGVVQWRSPTTNFHKQSHLHPDRDCWCSWGRPEDGSSSPSSLRAIALGRKMDSKQGLGKS